MKPNNSGRRPTQIAAAFGAILLTAGCASAARDTVQASLPSHMDRGVGQLLQYCTKFQESGDLTMAAGLCERAHRLDPADPAPLTQLAEILVAMGRTEQAINAYRRILETSPDNAQARLALGKLYVSLGQHDLAVAELRTAVQDKPGDPRIYNALGVAHGLQGAHEAALHAFEAGLRAAPEDMSLRSNQGLSLVLNGRYEEGIQVLEALAADPHAKETSRHNLQLAYNMVNAAHSDEATAEKSSSDGLAPEGAGMVERTPVASAEPPPAPVAHVEEVSSPLALSEAPAPEAGPEGLGSAETEAGEPASRAQAEDAAPVASARTDPPRRWPRRMQTARVGSAGTADSDAPSAFMGEYMSADAGLEPAPEEPDAPEPEVAARQPDAPTTAAPGGQDYSVQLASYRSEARAERGWAELVASAPDLLESLEPVIRRADLGEGRGTFYRLRTAPTTRDDADALCTALQSRGLECLIIKQLSPHGDGGARRG